MKRWRSCYTPTAMVTKRIELPADLAEAIRTAAERSGQPEHELIVNALRGRFAPRPQNPLPRDHPLHEIVGIAEDPGFRSEDIEERPGQGQSGQHLRSMGVVSVPGVRAADVDEWLAANWRPDEEWGHDDSAAK